MSGYEDYEKADFGDSRLDKRFPRLLVQLSSNPNASIPAACRDPHQAKAVYRFLTNENATIEKITKITREVTLKNINKVKPSVVLIPQDTSGLSYNTLKATNGLGSIGTGKNSLGIHVHSAIAIGESGEVYGLLAQKLWVRPPEEYGQSDATRSKLPIEEKESYKWLETIEKVGTSFPEGTMAVHICDREGDIYEFFSKAEKEGVHYLCRSNYNRDIKEDDGSKKLNNLINSISEVVNMTVRVSRDSHTGRIARDAEVAVKFVSCEIMKPSQTLSNKELPQSIKVYVISAVETNPPDGEKGISWQLITNVPTESLEEAKIRIHWYTQRWKIETFHKTLKSGCKVEELQYDTADKLKKLIAIYSIIALQIMLLTYVARTHPEESCEICFTEEEWKTLYRASKRTRTLPEQTPTIYEAVILIAKLGGFLGRKSDGFPGVAVIWRGLTALYTILDAIAFLSA
jgi:hypothetical protein